MAAHQQCLNLVQILIPLKRYLILCLLAAFAQPVFAQSVSPLPLQFFPCTYSAGQASVFSLPANPAAPVLVKSFTAGLYAQRRFMLAQPVQLVFGAALPFENAGLGMQLNHLQNGAFTQSEAGIAYARKLGKIDIGVRFNYHRLTIAAYGSAAGVVVDVGSFWQLAKGFSAGLRVYNPVGGRLGSNGLQLGSSYTAGFGYEASAQVLLSIEISKIENKPVLINAGLQYLPADKMMLQAGIAAGEPFLTTGFNWKDWRMRITVSNHSQLGFTPTTAFSYSSPKQHVK